MTSRTLPTSPTQIRAYLQLLRLERALTPATQRAELEDLEDEIDATRTAYVGAAVTEIAVLRAELSGAQRG